MIVSIQELDKLTKNLKKITAKTKWTGEETGIILVSRAIENYIKKNYEEVKDLNFFNFDYETYKQNYRAIASQAFKNSSDLEYLSGYIKMNKIFYANFSYTTANEEIIKARSLYFGDKLKTALNIEMALNSNIFDEKNKAYYENVLLPLSITAMKPKTKKIQEAIKDLEDALYWLKGYVKILELITKIYKLDLLYLMQKEIELFIEKTYKEIDEYNSITEKFKNYIYTYSKVCKEEKIDLLEKAYKKIKYNYEIPKDKIKQAKKVMQTPVINSLTKVNFYCYDNDSLTDLLCYRSENE